MLPARPFRLSWQCSPARRVFTLTMLLLGLAVFCWGLHDKLSLYAPPTAPPPVAKVKLLSQMEQVSAQDHAQVRQPETVVPPLLLGFFLSLLALLGSTPRPEPAERQMRRQACRPPDPAPLRRRPPPYAAARPQAPSRPFCFAQPA